MRLNIWDSYTPDTSLLLYPAYSGFLLNSFSRSSRSQSFRSQSFRSQSSRSQFFRSESSRSESSRSQFFSSQCLRPPFCTLRVPPNRPRTPRPNGLSLPTELDNSRNILLTSSNQENQNEPEEKAPITDIVIPMSLYLYQLFEPNLFWGSTPHLPLYHLWSNYLVYLE